PLLEVAAAEAAGAGVRDGALVFSPRGGPEYILPASTSIGLDAAADGVSAGAEGRPAKNLSTMAAISSRFIFPAATAAAGCFGCGAATGIGLAEVVLNAAGRVLLTGLVSKAMRLMS